MGYDLSMAASNAGLLCACEPLRKRPVPLKASGLRVGAPRYNSLQNLSLVNNTLNPASMPSLKWASGDAPSGTYRCPFRL